MSIIIIIIIIIIVKHLIYMYLCPVYSVPCL